MILTVAADAVLELKPVFGGKEIRADHNEYRIYPSRNVNKIFGFSVTRGIIDYAQKIACASINKS